MSSENSSRPEHSYTNNGKRNGSENSNNGHGPNAGPHPIDHGPQSENGNGYGHRHVPAYVEPSALSDRSDTLPYGGTLDWYDVFSDVNIAIGWMAEDNDNAKHTDGEYTPSEAMTPESTELGVPISIWLTPQNGGEYNDGYLDVIEIRPVGMPSFSGTFYDNTGKALTNRGKITDEYGNVYEITLTANRLRIVVDSEDSSWRPVDLSGLGLHFKPDVPFSDRDIRFNIDVDLTNELGAFGNGGGGRFVEIDAVADLPDYLGGAVEDVFIGPSEDGVLTASDTAFENGVATQTVGGGLGSSGSDVVFSLGNVQFYDYTDNSEEHFILVNCDDAAAKWHIDVSALGQGNYEAFVAPAGDELETVWLNANNLVVDPDTPGAVRYYKVNVDNAYLAANDGQANLSLPVIMEDGTENGTHTFDVKVGAQENPANTPTDKEIDWDNNLALRDVEAVKVNVQALESKLAISTGWAYESAAVANSGDNPDADPVGAGVVQGQATFPYIGEGGAVSGSAAIITLTAELGPGETLGDWVTLSFDASRGDIYSSAGVSLTSSAGGKAFASIPKAWLEDGSETLYFVPNPDSDDDSDILINYQLSIWATGQDGQPKEFTVNNDIPIIVDAVADPAGMTLDPSGEAPEFDGFVLDYTATIHADDTETQYIVISDPSGLLNPGTLDPTLFTQVSLADLLLFESDPVNPAYFGSIGPNDIILRIEDLAALDMADSAADGTINLKIPFTVSNRNAAGDQLDVTVKTVVVEGGGNNAGNWDPTQDTEYDFANNIAITEDTATVYLAKGDVTITAANDVHEGDQPGQYDGDATEEYGTALNVEFDDPCEAIRDISFTLTTADGSPVDGSIAFGYGGGNPTLVPKGGSLRFTAEEHGGVAKYTSVDVLDHSGAVIASYAITPASTLQELNAAGEASGLRFIPSGDSDVDVRVEISAKVTDVRSGDVISKTDIPPITIARDAVADPADASSAIEPSTSGHVAVVAGSTITVNIDATFTDYKDGSEAQYIFVSKDYLSSIAVPDALSGALAVLAPEQANAICAQVNGPGGMTDASADTHFVIEVGTEYLKNHGGSLSLPLEATLRTDIAKDGSETLDIKAVTVEHDGFLTGSTVENGDVEPDNTNNVAVDDASTTIAWATLENVFDIAVEGPAYENDQPNQHVGNTEPGGGAGISITPQDASEVFDTLTISYEHEDGSLVSGSMVLSVGGGSLTIPTDATLNFAYDSANPTSCISVTCIDKEGNTQSLSVPGLTLAQLTSQGLRYVPDSTDTSKHDDLDVKVTFSGTTRETETGEEGTYGPQTVQVMVDAVADMPDGSPTEYDYTQYPLDAHGNPYTAIAEGSPVSFGVNTTFHDYADNSEKHYLFINTKYFADGNFTIIDNVTGLAFTGGTAISDTDALYAQINGNPGIPGPDDTYVVLEIDPAYLDTYGGVLDLTVRATLKDAAGLLPYGPEKTPLQFEVKAVAVEHEGYLTSTSTTPGAGNDEYRADNNVSVRDIGSNFVWDALSGQFDVTPETAHEGNQPDQYTGDFSPANGAGIRIAPRDDTEVFTRMRLDYDDAHGKIVLNGTDADGNPASVAVTPNEDITFAFDPANPTHIVSVTCNGATLNVGGLTLESFTSANLRYVPNVNDNDDADVVVTITADTLETTTGTTATATLDPFVVVVDAVADMPQGVSSTLQVTNGKNDTVIVNPATNTDSFDIDITASFGEYADGNEGHYIFVGADYIAALQGLPTGITQLDPTTAADIVSNAGLSGTYFVLQVSDDYLKTNSGAVNVTLTAHLDNASLPDEDQTLSVDIKAGAIEHQGYNTPENTDLGNGHGQDDDATNNVSLVDMSLDLRYARLDDDFTVAVSPAHEGDAPDQHVGNNSPAGGATVDFAPTDLSEVFDTLTVNYDGTNGSLYLDLPTVEYDNISVELPKGATLAFTYRNDGPGATKCIKVTVTLADGSVTDYTLSDQLSLRNLMGDGRLHYIPDADSQSDADVNITFSGTSRETATNETGQFSRTLTVAVDAVADKPEAAGNAANQDAGRKALEPGVPFNVTVNADFGKDLEDNSEAHYVFISKNYLAALSIPAALASSVTVLSAAAAAAVCAQVDDPNGIPGADPDDYFVLAIDNAWLQAYDGKVALQLEGVLKDAATLKSAGALEGADLSLDMKAVAVEHDGFRTSTTDDLGQTHGKDTDATNNVSVDDASAIFRYAVADDDIHADAAPAYEGDQPGQHEGNLDQADGATITLAPRDESEVFTELTLNYDNANGSLVLTSPGNSAGVVLGNGAKLVFTYDPVNLTECLSIEIWQPGASAPAATLSYADALNSGLSLTNLTANHLKYVPDAGDHHDADVPVAFSGTVLETESGHEASVNGSLTVVVDAVADLAENVSGSSFVTDGTGSRPAALPGETITVTLEAEFSDYGEDDASDASEAHYIFIAKENLPTLNGVPGGVNEITDAATLAGIFNAIAEAGGQGIHSGPGAAADYHVLELTPGYLQSVNGKFSMNLTTTAGSKGIYPVEVKAVSVEHDGYRTDPDSVDGAGTDQDVTAANNVAVADMSVDLVVREFEPEKVKVTLESEWAYENDRSQGDEQYYSPTDTALGRDNGVQLLFEGPGDGYVVSSITLEYAMPSNGSAAYHEIRSTDPNVSIVYDTNAKPGSVIVTVTASDPYGGVGDLFFVPGDNYDNDDVDITVDNIEVADPLLHMTSDTMPGWGTGVEPGSENLHVKVDAVAQAPEVDIAGVSHDSGNPVAAGEKITITGEVSFEDTNDGSEEHFILLEMQDGYYPDSVTLKFNGETVTIPIMHYNPGDPSDPSSTPTDANYTMQQLVTRDDGQPHLFMKLSVDDYLEQLKDGGVFERMDDIEMAVVYQTREWAAEGTSLHFAAISTEDVENVREYDANFNITNDELPFDKQLEQYVPGLTVTDNNTAITIAAQGAYVYWDSNEEEDVSFKGFVAENDRPSDHQREPAYILDSDPTDGKYDIVDSFPVDPSLQPFDPVTHTGRDYGTGIDLNIPANTTQVWLDAHVDNKGQGDFYFLPTSVWTAYMTSPAPLDDSALAGYKVALGGPASVATGSGPYSLVFIPSHEPYDASHTETGASHRDYDFRFNYEIYADQLGPDGTVAGQKKYVGENEVIRVDAVANQAELVYAGTDSTDQFSLWAGANKTTAFDLTVRFHDLDGTEDHYILVEMVPNFAFKCGSYYHQPGSAGSMDPNNNESIYTHVMTDENGNQTFIRYYKIPVNQADIDPVTGEVTVEVEFVRQPGMPSVADYPSSQNLTYGALTEDKTASRWDSYDPTSDTFINRKGADGEYSYDNNTSVIIRNGIENGDPNDGEYNPWRPGDITIVGGGGGEPQPGGGGGYIHWENGPGSGWSGGYWPVGGGEPGGYWKEDGPGGGGGWWAEQHGGATGGGSIEDWIPSGGGGWKDLPGGTPGGGGTTNWQDNKWIASHSQGLAIEWVFENSTPIGHTWAGQYNSIVPTEIFLTGENPNAQVVKIGIPNIVEKLINVGSDLPWEMDTYNSAHPKATLAIGPDPDHLTAITGVFDPVAQEWIFTIPAPGGELPPGMHLFMIVAPDSMGEDFQLGVQWEDANGGVISSGKADVLVDAVAQWANFKFADNEDGMYGVTGDEPQFLQEVNIDVAFLDQDGSESNYVLVEKIPGVLPLHKNSNGDYDPVREVYLEGKTYFVIEPTATEQQSNHVQLWVSVNEELTSPMYVRDDIVYKGMEYTGMQLTVGTMTVEGQTGSAADPGTNTPANWEFTLDNNTSLNLREDGLTIVISKVDAEGGNSTIKAVETHAPEDNLVWLDPNDPANGLNLTMDGNDILTSLIFTSATGNGSFWYEDDNGIVHPLPTGVDMSAAYLAGKIFYKQDRYQDADARLEWTADVKDGLNSSSQATVGGTLTVAVDAVAKAEEIHLSFPKLDKAAGTLTQTLTFDDFQANEQHYAVIAPDLYRVIGKTAQVKGPDGAWNTVNVETIFDPDGNPYYAVLLDGYLDAGGSATVRFTMHELNIPGIENFPVISGGVSIEPNSGYFADDREPDLANNWAINSEAEFVGQGVVSSTNLAFTAVNIVEDDPNGEAITLTGQIGANDAVVSAVLTFTPSGAALSTLESASSAAFTGGAGEQIATIVYDGQCFAVTLDGAGNAVANVDFGAGFDPAADFRIIWGVARMTETGLVVDSWNHDANGMLDLNTVFTVTNTLSGQTQTITGPDPDGITLTARADLPLDVSGQLSAINDQPATPADPIGAGEDSLTVRVSGEFVDLDGSETHYLLLEVPQNWSLVGPLNGSYETINGVRYYRVEADPTQANPAVDITLRAPDGLNSDVTLRTGAQAVEGNAHSQFAQGADVTLHLSDVSADSLSATASPIVEDGLLSLTSLADAVLLHNDGNDILLGVTFTDLRGGSIVDASGAPVSGLSFTAEQLASGQLFYRPAANYAGELDARGKPLPIVLGYDAQLGESDTGALATLTGQTLSVIVTPEADAPENVGGISNTAALDNIQTGHKAAVSVSLQAAFADVDGSEDHFFVVRTPGGVTVQNGADYTFVLLDAEDCAAMGLPADFPTGGLLYKITLDDNTQTSASLALNLEVTTTIYNGGQLDVLAGTAELRQDDTTSYAWSNGHSVQLPPAIEHEIGNADPMPVPEATVVDSLRATSVSGSLETNAVDPDGDSVSPEGVRFGDVQGARGTVDGRACYTVQGQYGTLHLFDDGSYRYDLAPDSYGIAAQEVFNYQLADNYGGTGESTITITLDNANTAPVAGAFTAQLDSVRQSAVSEQLLFQDAENDVVSVVGVNDNTTPVNFGTAEDPLWGFEVAGDYGTLRVWRDAQGQWQYTYALDAAHKGETRDEHFTLVLRDAHGMESRGSLDVDLYNVNTPPVAQAGGATLDTLRDADGESSGNLVLSDADNDPVTLSAASGPDGAAGIWGQDDQGQSAMVVQGRYGALYLYQNGSDALQYRYVLTSDQAGGIDAVESFTYTVDDGFLGTASSTIDIDLSNANAAPVITGDLSNELDTLRDADRITRGDLAFSDPDYNPDQGRNDLVRLSNVAFNGLSGTMDDQGGFTVNGAYGVFHIDANGAYTYTLNADDAGALGVESFTVTLTDEFGASRSETVDIDLVVHNQNPTASSGSVSLNTWRDGGQASGLVTLADPDGDAVTVDSVTGVAPGVWGADPDGNPAFVVQGAHGMLYLHENGAYTYVLDDSAQGMSGTDAFSFTVRDGFGGSAENVIAINLSDANAAPVLNGDLAAAIEGSIQDYEEGIVRESGQINWSDADGDPIGSVSVAGVALPASGEISVEGQYGTLVVTTDGGMNASWVYTMHEGLDMQGITDVDSFDIVVRDIYGGEASQSLDIALTPLTHAPECEDLNLNWPQTPMGPASFLTGDLPFSDADMGYDPDESLQLSVNGSAVTEQVTVQGRYGALTINPDGSFTYTTEYLDQDLLEDFTYTVTDSTGNSDEAHLYIRLSDNAPAFPNEQAEHSLSGEDRPLMPDTAENPLDDATSDDVSPDDAAPMSADTAPDASSEPVHDAHDPYDALPEPVDVDLANVPLPYDPADPGLGLSA